MKSDATGFGRLTHFNAVSSVSWVLRWHAFIPASVSSAREPSPCCTNPATTNSEITSGGTWERNDSCQWPPGNTHPPEVSRNSSPSTSARKTSYACSESEGALNTPSLHAVLSDRSVWPLLEIAGFLPSILPLLFRPWQRHGRRDRRVALLHERL